MLASTFLICASISWSDRLVGRRKGLAANAVDQFLLERVEAVGYFGFPAWPKNCKLLGAQAHAEAMFLDEVDDVGFITKKWRGEAVIMPDAVGFFHHDL